MPVGDAMKSPWRIAIPIGCIALICGAAITWHFVAARVAEHKLVADAKACRARAEQGDAKAESDLASMYYHGKGVPQDYGEALRWYSKAANQGNAKAEYALGFMYSQGQGVPRDYVEAVAWYRKAAEQGDRKAQDGIASRFYQGQGVPQDYREAVRWYHKAADQGDAVAEDGLGFMYYRGLGVPQDYTEAARWYRSAADQGYAKAQYDIGYAYYEGQGVSQDYAEAAQWYRKAAKQGDEYARRALDSMKIGYTTQSKINLSIIFLLSIVLLMRSLGSIRNRQQRQTALAGLLGLLGVGLRIYWHSHYGILLSLSVVNAFYFGRSLLSGIIIATLASLVWPKVAKGLIGLSGILFIAFNVYAITHYELRHLAASLRVFYSANGLLIGIAGASAALLWLEQTRGNQNGNDGVAPGTVAASGTEPLRM
jgi:TPR repeat protein